MERDSSSDSEGSVGKHRTHLLGKGHFQVAGTHGHHHGHTRLKGMGTARISSKYIALTAWTTFMLVALFLNPKKAWPFVLMTAVGLAVFALSTFGLLAEIRKRVPEAPAQTSWVVLGVLGVAAIALVVWLLISSPTALQRQYRLQSLFGGIVLIGGSIFISRKRESIPWRLVSAGLLCQFYLGFFVIRTQMGYNTFKAMGDGATNFLSHADVASQFVFGDNFRDHFFAFAVLPVTIFFSAFCACMYYMGLLQFLVRVIAAVLKFILASSTVESVNSAGNIFLGQTEAPLLVKPMLPTATPSEIHAIMTGGFATVAGSVLAAYVSMGVNPNQLIGASVMSAPAALTISKIMCPDGVKIAPKGADKKDPDAEDEEASKLTQEFSPKPEDAESDDEGKLKHGHPDEFKFPPPTENNIIEAAGNGASIAISLVANIAAMLIAFLALISALDAALTFLGSLVNKTLTFNIVCGWLFTPVAFILGTPWEDCQKVASLIGTKIVINEFVAYAELAKLIKAKDITARGELIATYALCGFSNIGSIGIQMGALSALCPERKNVFSNVVVTAMVAGNVCCFLTAVVAGILQGDGK